MNIEAKRNELIQWILNLNEDSLSKVDALKRKTSLNNVVAYSIDGTPLTLAEYHKELEEAEKEIERGEYLTSDELEKEISSWVK